MYGSSLLGSVRRGIARQAGRGLAYPRMDGRGGAGVARTGADWQCLSWLGQERLGRLGRARIGMAWFGVAKQARKGRARNDGARWDVAVQA